MSNLKVLIVGASIAGPTAAYWFARAGANVTIIERFPSLRTGGQNIDIRTTGVTVMRKTPGMEAAVRAKLFDLEGLRFCLESGRPFATMTASKDAEQQTLVSEYEIFRGDLARVLVDMTEGNDKVKYVYDEQIAAIKQGDGDGPVTVEFQNHLSTAEYDLVVACDGATSRTRALGLECGVRDHIVPLNSWMSFFSFDRDILGGSRYGHAWSAVGGRWIVAGPDPKPGRNRGGLSGINQKPEDMEAWRQAVKQGDEALKSYVAKKFDGLGWKTKDVVQGMWESKDFYSSEVCQVKVPSIYKGRFVLVGDAGYAPGPTGGGTTLAMVGAYTLAGEICAHKGDIAAGLKAYEERMRPIITDFQKIPPGVPTILAPQTWWGIALRNMLLFAVTWSAKVFSWVGQYWAASTAKDKYGVLDYPWVNEK